MRWSVRRESVLPWEIRGGGTEDVADYVTDDIDRDGVWKACRHFGG